MTSSTLSQAPPPKPPQRKIHINLTIDFDALSGLLGTGAHPSNTLSDYAAASFSGTVGVPRLLKLLSKLGIADRVTWFLPGHSIQTFPIAAKQIVSSGAEIALHGYSHEGADQMSRTQERDVVERCIEVYRELTGDQEGPRGWRAPLYQINEGTIALLREKSCFWYDSSISGHDSQPYLLPDPMPKRPVAPDFEQMQAKEWMVPGEGWEEPVKGDTARKQKHPLVEIPGSWYTEDMTPMAYYPYTPNSQGYVAAEVVEKMWWNRFTWLWENECDVANVDYEEGKYVTVFPLILHPETSGRAHIIGMLERFIVRLLDFKKDVEKAGYGEVSFVRMDEVAGEIRKHLQRTSS